MSEGIEKPAGSVLRLLWCLFTVALVTCLSACGRDSGDPGTATDPDGVSTRSVFRHAMDQVPSQFDPIRSGNAYSNAVVLNVYDTLYRYRYLARPYELAPQAAEAMPMVSADGLEVTVRLRTDLYFADDPAFPGGKGRAVTAKDVEYSFKRHFMPDSVSEGAWLWQDVLVGIDEWRAAGADPDQAWEAVTAINDRDVRFRLRAPFPQLPYTLTQGYSAIVAREVVQHYGADFPLRPVGSGPYQLQGFDGRVAQLRRNARYMARPLDLPFEGYRETDHARFGLASVSGETPLLDRIEIHFVPDAGQRIELLLADRVDAIDTRFGMAKELGFDQRIADCCHRHTQALSESIYVSINMRDPEIGESDDPLQSERRRALRCAIGAGYDWQARSKALYGGGAEVFEGVIPPAAPEFDVALRSKRKADVAMARRWLAEHDWDAESLPVLRWASTSGADMQQSFELFRAQMMAIGFPSEKLRWESFPDFGAYLTAVNAGSLMLMDLGWNLDYPDALSVLQLYYGPNAPPQVNSSAYQNADFDRDFEQARTMARGSERDVLYQRMNEQVRRDCAAISGLARSRDLFWRKDFFAFPDREMLGAGFLRYVDVRGR